jgi:hypothetical protein
MGFFKEVVCGQKIGSEAGSNFRRLTSRITFLILILLVFEYFFTQIYPMPKGVEATIAYICAGVSIIFFLSVVLAIPFLTSENFKPNPIRLFADALISIMLSILAFAMCYRVLGIVPPDGEIVSRFDHYYFSAVTFSTLGFGDFRPHQNARFVAAAQALIGNLHLGIIVGAAFFAAQPKS